MFRGDLLSAILALFSIFSVVLCDWRPRNPEDQPICTTNACAARGQEYLANMMRSVDPCQDFFTFACGSWNKNHPSPPYTKWNVLTKMEEDTLTILKKLLDRIPSSTIPMSPKFAKLKKAYAACLRIPFYEKATSREITVKINQIGRYPAKNIWDIHSNYLRLTGESALFDVDIGIYDPKMDIPMLQFSQVASPYGSIYHDHIWKDTDRNNYAAALFKMLSSLNFPKETPAILNRRIQNVIKFRHRLNAILEKIRQAGPPLKENNIQASPHDLEAMFQQIQKSKSANNNKLKIPWEKTAKILLRDSAGPAELKKDIVVLKDRNYFMDLYLLLDQSTEQEIADHMEVHFIERHLIGTKEVQQLLKKSWTNVPPTAQALRFDEPRWMTCISHSNLKPVLAELFINYWLKIEHKEKVEQILDKLKEVIGDQMAKATWLDEMSIDMMAIRMDEIDKAVGYPPKKLKSYTPAKNIYPDAHLNSVKNVLYVHAAMLQSPVYDHRLPYMYNIATTGFMLGHEYHHVLGDCGTFPVSETKSESLWSEEIQKKCKKRKQCFINEYDKYTKTEFRRRYNIAPTVNTAQSFSENYPDVMGLEAAFLIHDELKKKSGGKCEILPGFRGYTCDQMFFVAFANLFCGTPERKRAEYQLRNGVHSIDPVRVNGAVSSSEAFAKAFQCGKQDPMNPSTKCNMWK